MVDLKIEEFDAAGALSAGLVDAILNGSAKVSGMYELTENGVEYDQNNFAFKDKWGALRIGRFKDNAELLTFLSLFGK